MKKTIYLIMLLISFKNIAQNNYNTRVTYKVNFNFDISVSSLSELVFNNSKSYYTEGVITTKKNLRQDKMIEHVKNHNRVFNLNLEDNSIYTKDNLNGEIILVKEKVTKILWKIHKTVKDTILGYNCTKATGNFRGRSYTVWYTEEIPVKYGPWKLNGLPGLILEVKDNFNQVEFIVEKIETFVVKKKFEFDFLKNENKYPIINLKEYVSELNKDLQNQVKKIIAKMPRASKMINLKFKKYKGLELNYE